MFRSVFSSGIRSTYNVLENPSFMTEPWAVYPAKHRASGKVASVFIFDKSKFESLIYKLCQNSSNTKNPKVIIAECYELIKFEISQISKLKHPQILTILEVLEETKLKFLFVSEAVTGNLLTTDIQTQLDELSIQKGLLQIAKGVQFLHNYCSIIHFNLQPSSIFINSQGDWKLAGFKFLQNLNEISPSERDNFYIMHNSSIVTFDNLNVNFTAPELLADTQLKLDFANDIWSFGCLVYYLYNNGDLLINTFDNTSISDYKQEFKKFENKFYNHRPSELKYLLKNIPEKMYPMFTQIMARFPSDRITIDQFIDSDYFNGSVIKAMWFIDEFSTKTMDEKLIFLEGLLEIDPTSNTDLLSQFPQSFKTLKLLPLLLDLITSELNVSPSPVTADDISKVISHALDITLKIGSALSGLTFQDRIYDVIFKNNPKTKKTPGTFTKLINSSVPIRLALVENLPTLQKKLKDVQLIDMVKSILEIVLAPSTDKTQIQEQIKLQETFLQQLENFIGSIEFPYIKNTLFPLLCQVFKTTTVLSTKLVTIDTFDMLVEKKIIDKLIVNDQLFPIFKNLKSRDKRIVGKVLSFFGKLCRSEHISLDLESSVESVLPQCYSLVFGCNDCSQQEFEQFMVLINRLQESLVEKKMLTLPTSLVSSLTDNGNFESLIKSQTISNGNKEKMLKAPQSKNVLQPTRRGNPQQQSNQQPKLNVPMKPNTPSKPSVPLKSNTPLKPHTPLKSNAPLKPYVPLKPQSPLNFGSVGNTPNVSNNKLLSTLQSSFPKKVEPEDDFEDFQQASPSGIDWNTEVTKSTTPTWNTEPSSNSAPTPVNSMGLNSNWGTSQSNTSNWSSTNNAEKKSNYPPGFNSNLVLTPNSTGPKPSNTPAKTNNSDLLDFL